MSAGQQVDDALTIVQRTAGILISMVGPSPKRLSTSELTRAANNLDMAAGMLRNVLKLAPEKKHDES